VEVTIKTTNQPDAIAMLNGSIYLSFITEFCEWLEGPGRESSGQDVLLKYRQAAELYRIQLP
jgi:hypothetical protein